jgi:hypothetical protein
VVERGTLYVDGYAGNTGDLSTGRGGHVYINKPPGVSLLAAIPYAALYALERLAGAPIDSWWVMTLNAWWVTVATCGVTGALIPAILYLHARRRLLAPPPAALAAALAVAFGTIVLPYSTMLFAHVPSAAFLLLALAELDRRPLLAGAAAGVAGATFYVCIPAALVLAALAAARSWRGALRFVAGGLPLAALLAAYHWACFGSPLTTAVEGGATFTQEGLLLGVLRWPAPTALWGLTFSPFRGLFFVSPVLLTAFVGAVEAARRRDLRAELAGIAGVVAVFLVAVGSFNGWHGGSAFGPRYLLPLVPLLGIPLVFAVRRLRWLWLLLAAVSAAIQLLATAVDPMPSAALRDPLRQYLLPAFLHGELSAAAATKAMRGDPRVGAVGINVQAIDEYGPQDRHAPDSREARWASFNLGELLVGAGRRASLLPLVAWLLGGVWLLRRWSLGAAQAR